MKKHVAQFLVFVLLRISKAIWMLIMGLFACFIACWIIGAFGIFIMPMFGLQWWWALVVDGMFLFIILIVEYRKDYVN